MEPNYIDRSTKKCATKKKHFHRLNCHQKAILSVSIDGLIVSIFTFQTMRLAELATGCYPRMNTEDIETIHEICYFSKIGDKGGDQTSLYLCVDSPVNSLFASTYSI